MTSEPPGTHPGPYQQLTERARAMWGSGDFARAGAEQVVVGELLARAIDVHPGERVLDVAAGSGNAALAAARRGARVVASDFVPAVLDRAVQRARVDGLDLETREADAQALPFGDGAFDVVLSTFGVMFAPNQSQAASELMRVCRPGGRIGLANWTPEGFIGKLFKVIGQYVPPAPGLKSPALWGTRAHLNALFGPDGQVNAKNTDFIFRYKSPEHWLTFFRGHYGPVLKAFEAIDPEAREGLQADIDQLLRELNIARDGTLVIPGEYLEVVITKKS